MNTAHTPGPWRALDRLDGRHAFPVLANDQDVAGACARANVLAGFGKEKDAKSRSPEGQPEAWANARLIAAAPDLLAALRDVVSTVPFGQPGHVDLPDAIARGKAIIAELDGQS